jgi:hypothetical protein
VGKSPAKPLTRATPHRAPRSPLAELLIAEDYSSDFCLIQEKIGKFGMTLVSGATEDSRQDSPLDLRKGARPF